MMTMMITVIMLVMSQNDDDVLVLSQFVSVGAGGQESPLES